ncbi:ankyrin repeat-containing domain protein [Podospora appendiculata]|uniref:protein S-acyltransferase n=1 Tax=Podospora appendiculata TaxID=314037 RepID=A0AAE1CD87_9PEZI|nr:ankyrin repeat-containing domain protein [Podospora appendiculata]
MAEIAGLTSAILAIVDKCAKIGFTIRHVRNTVKNGPSIVHAIAVECSVTVAVLKRLQVFLDARPQLLDGGHTAVTGSMTNGDLGLGDSFEALLLGIGGSIDELVAEIDKISWSKEGSMTFLSKAKFVLKEDSLKGCRQELREQRATLALLLDCLQVESLATVEVHLERADEQTTSSHGNKPTSANLNRGSISITSSNLVTTNPGRRQLSIGSTVSDSGRSYFSLRFPGEMDEFEAAVRFKTRRPATPSLLKSLHAAIDSTDVQQVFDGLYKDPKSPLPESDLRPIDRVLRTYPKDASGKGETVAQLDEIMCMLILAGADAGPRSASEMTPFSLAIHDGASARVIRLMCDNGADVNAKDPSSEHGTTPLQRAILTDSPDDVLLALVASGAEIDKRDATGYTALMDAVHRQRVETARKLLDYGADPNIDESNGWSPLQFALGHGTNANPEMVQLLCDRDASLTHLYKLPVTNNLSDVARCLLESKANPNVICNRNCQSPFNAIHLAAEIGNIDRLRLLLEHGAEINSVDPRKNTPLRIAIGNSHTDAAALLIESGADLGSEFCRAAKEGMDSIITLVLDHIHASDVLGVSVISYAANEPIILEFILSQVDRQGSLEVINQKGCDNNAALHWAVIFGKAASVEILLQAGAEQVSAGGLATKSPDGPNRVTGTPAEMARALGESEIVAIFEDWEEAKRLAQAELMERRKLHFAILKSRRQLQLEEGGS